MVACFFLAMEGVTRTKFFDMSKDFRRFPAYYRRAAQLSRAPGVSVALLGNSSTDRGIDPDALEARFKAAGITTGVDKFVADSSHIETWYYMANQYFWKPKSDPKLIVVTFFGTSLQDGNRLDLGRLAQFFTTPGDWRQVMGDLPDNGSRIEYAASAVWATYAVRDRIQERALNVFVPKYKSFVRELHRENAPDAADVAPTPDNADKQRKPMGNDNAHDEKKAESPPPTYRVLKRFLETARAHGSKVCFVDFPTSVTVYELDRQVPRIVKAAGGEFFDLRRLPGMKASFYDDPIHLNDAGRVYYTTAMARLLVPVVAGMKRQTYPRFEN
jgi:hypothetical protein